MNKHTLLFSLLVFALFSAGCSSKKKPDGLPTLYPCEIVVKQEGAPLTGATVMLLSEDNSVSWTVGGGTNDAGVARIFTHGDFAGAPLGRYKVTITKNVIENSPTPEQLSNPNFSGPMGEAYDYVDLQYKTKDSTPLNIEITAGKNTQEYEVGAPIRERVKIL